EAHRLLRDHAQPALEACDRHSGARVHVHRAVHVSPPAQDAAVQREARAVDAGPLVEVLVHAHLDEVRRRDLRPQQLVPLHQELSIFPGNAHGAVIVNVVIPAMVRDQAIDRGEIDAGLPFRGRDRPSFRGFRNDIHALAPYLALWTGRANALATHATGSQAAVLAAYAPGPRANLGANTGGSGTRARRVGL